MAISTLSLEEKEEEVEKTWMQIVAILIASFSGVTYGLLLAWTSPFIIQITSEDSGYNITLEQASWLVYVSEISMVIFSIVFSTLSDIIGRKKNLMLVAILHLSSWICTVISKNTYLLFLSRIFSGAAEGCITTTLPVYIAEISSPHVRGTWGNFYMVLTFFGIFLMNIIGNQVDVSTAAFICMPIPIIFLVMMLYIPESPYWYIIKGKNEDARQSLKILRRVQQIESIFSKLKHEIDVQMQEEGSWRDLFIIEANRRALLAGTFVRCAQMFGGISAFISFAQYIYQELNTDISAQIPTLVFSGECFVLLIFSGYIIERIGKKKCFVITNFLSGILFISQAIFCFLNQNLLIDDSFFKYPAMAAPILYAIFISFGNVPIPTLMMGELFSSSVKSKGVSLLTIAFGVTYFLNNFIFFTLSQHIGIFASFLFFGIVSIVASVLAFPLLPETAGKTLEEIQLSLK